MRKKGSYHKNRPFRLLVAAALRFVQSYLNDIAARVYLKTHDVTGSEEFLRCARHFFAGILTYFKEKMTRRTAKRPAVRVRWEFSDTP